MTHCCETMRREVDRVCDQHPDRFDCPDCLVHYSPGFREYGIIIHDGGSSTCRITHCPWCGTRLPDTLRDATAPLLTADEFFDLPARADGSKQELVRGVVVSEPPIGIQRGEVRGTVGFVIQRFLKSNRIGRAATSSGVITARNPDTVRGPDVSFYSIARMPLDLHVARYHTVPPDLCVEVMSPSNTLRSLKDKAKEYLFAGVRVVWIVDPADRAVTIITEPLESRVLEAEATLDGGDVLPGFSCKVAGLFE